MKSLPEKYQPKEWEHYYHHYWQEHRIYQWNKCASREETYVIDTPPPTVSGSLHMGHVFSYTQADFIARFQRMYGKTVFYPMGFDDNGLPTERLVEKVKNVRARDMSREAFVEYCEEVAEEARIQFRALFQSIALSVDWQQEYHTVSHECWQISQLSFLDLFHKGKVYRKLQPMLWDPVDKTAIAQAEIEDKEQESFMNYIYFKVKDSTDTLVIATTRPEMIAACGAVFFHPDDLRYQHLVGKTAVTPLFKVEVPLLADERVAMEKGSGLVMCCTFGDEMDIRWWKDHQLPTRIILNEHGKLCHLEGVGRSHPLTYEPWPSQASLEELNGLREALEGKTVKAARTYLIEILKNNQLLARQEPLIHVVKCAERSGAPLEILPTYQWFIALLDQKEAFKEKAAQVHWYPAHMKIRMDQWIEGLAWDWCISRQRYFGVPFPVWYSKRPGEEGKILVAAKEQLPVNPLVDLPLGYSKEEVEPEADVMDTWATSSVSPQLSSHAITKEYTVDYARHQKLFPADLRPQAHEIIRTWAFYTLVKSHFHENTVPWHNIMISGWCLASDKTKMSKSKGNVITPVNLVEEKGADVVRYWATTSRLGADTAYSEDVLKTGNKLINKLWNASKFAATHLTHIEGKPSTVKEDIRNQRIMYPIDIWLLSSLHNTLQKATKFFLSYEYCQAREVIEEFFWKDLCDNYLEIVKARAYDPDHHDPQGQQSAIYTIYHSLETLLRLLAPFLPHITEMLYAHVFAERQEISIHAQGMWPKEEDFISDPQAELSGKAVIAILDIVRKVKADKKVSLKWPLEYIYISSAEGGEKKHLHQCWQDLQHVTQASTLGWEEEKEPMHADSFITADGMFKVRVKVAESEAQKNQVTGT